MKAADQYGYIAEQVSRVALSDFSTYTSDTVVGGFLLVSL